MNEKNVSENLKNFYGANFEQYGATPFGVSWRDQDSMNLRYDRMLNVIDKTHITPIYSNNFRCGMWLWWIT